MSVRRRLDPRSSLRLAAIVLALVLPGCGDPPASDSPSTTSPTVDSSSSPPEFVNIVWRVSRSSSVQPGMLYAFLEDSTLVLASSTGAPAFGTWSYRGGALTMIEEGRSYPVDVVSLTHDSLSIVMRGPGLPVDMTLVPAGRSLPR